MSGIEPMPDDGATPFDVSGLRERSIRTRDQLNAAELANVLQAVEKYLTSHPSRRKAPFDVPWMLRLHREMFGKVWHWAGVARSENLNMGVPFFQIAEQMQQLSDDLRYWEAEWPDVIEQAVHLHVAAVRIHPFVNGNGRWSRLLADIWLAQHKHPITAWPAEIGKTESSLRRVYINAIKQAVNESDYDAILALYRSLTPRVG